MPDPITRKSPDINPNSDRFNENSYTAPKFRRDKDGNFNPTDYQAAMGLREFMHKNDLPFFSRDQLAEARFEGKVTIDDRIVQLSDQEKSMFNHLFEGLYERLDAGTNDSHDGWVGIKDINDAIRKPWKLHGAEKSPDGHWTDPAASTSITKQQAKEVALQLTDTLNERRIQKRDMHALEIDSMISTRSYAGVTIDGSRGGGADIDDPNVIQALILLRNDLETVDVDKNGFISKEEIGNWKV